MQRPRVIEIVAAILVCFATVSRAQQPPAAPTTQGGAEDLAKKLANPISDLVSVPFQFNWEQNVGPSEATCFILNVRPVMPFAMNKDWNLIARVDVSATVLRVPGDTNSHGDAPIGVDCQLGSRGG